VEVPYENGVITGADYQILLHMKQIFKDKFSISGGAISRDGRSSQVVFNGQIYPADFRETFVSPFGMRLLAEFRRLHDEAWTDQEMALENPMRREEIRRQMFEWEQFALQHPKHAAAVKERGKFRFAKNAPKHNLNISEEAEPGFLRQVHAQVQKMISVLVAIPGASRPLVVIHGVH
jgi:hypothetical protein